jgi:hypothetical protein
MNGKSGEIRSVDVEYYCSRSMLGVIHTDGIVAT